MVVAVLNALVVPMLNQDLAVSDARALVARVCVKCRVPADAEGDIMRLLDAASGEMPPPSSHVARAPVAAASAAAPKPSAEPAPPAAAPRQVSQPPAAAPLCLTLLGAQEDGGVYDRHVSYRIGVAPARGAPARVVVARRYNDFAALHALLIGKVGLVLRALRGGMARGGSPAAALSASGLDALSVGAGGEALGGVQLPAALAALRAFAFPAKAPLLSSLFVRPLAPSLLAAPEVPQRAAAFAAYLELLEGTGLAQFKEVRRFLGVA
jgi:hypothetical protein